MKAAELMTTGVRTCREHDKLSAAIQSMWDNDLGCLPVVDGAGRVVGMITDRDAAMALHFRGVPTWALQVADAMARIVFSAGPGDDLGRTLERMAEHQLRRLPIVDEDGRLAGILTLADVAQASAGRGRKPVLAKDVAELLAAVTRPRPPQLSETVVVEVTREADAEAGNAVLEPAKRRSKPRKAQTSRPAAAKKRGKPARAAR